MVDERKEARDHPETGQWSPGREALSGDELLNRIAEQAGAGDENRRARAKAVIDSEEIVQSFVYKVRRALRAVRDARGLSIEDAADMVGVSPSTLSRLETGATEKLDLKLVTQVALMLGVVPRMVFAPLGFDASVSVTDMQTVAKNPKGLEGLDQDAVLSPFGPTETGAVKILGYGEEAGAADPTEMVGFGLGGYLGYWRGTQDMTIRDLQTRLARLERMAALKQK